MLKLKFQYFGHQMQRADSLEKIMMLGKTEEIPGVTGKFGLRIQNEAGQRLTDFFQENTLVIANTIFHQQEKTLHMDITRWSILTTD